MEFFIHESGFIPGIEHIANHRRVRYRLVSGPNNAPIDPALEIIHYTQSFADHRLPAQSLIQRLSPLIQKQMNERRYLENQGALPRKAFMLNDANNWPTIVMPITQNPAAPQNPYQQMGMFNQSGLPQLSRMHNGGGAQHPFGQQPHGLRPGTSSGIGPPPAKRQRQAAPSRMPTGSSSAGVGGGVFDEAAQADEEVAPTGDLLDVLTPREISVTRYTQHHEWMEQILSSPWAVSQIQHVELGLGLAGDALSPLTDGIVGWAPDIAEPVVIAGGKTDEVEVQKLTQAHVEKLEERVRNFVEEGEAQIARMREEHRQRMEEMEGRSLFKDLERRLAEAMYEGAVGEEAEGEEDRKTVEDVVKEMERRTGAKVGRREEVVTVSNGGLVTPGGGELRGDEGVGFEAVADLQESGGGGDGGNSGLLGIGIGNGILAEEDAIGEGDVEIMHGGGGGGDGDGLAADDAFADLTNLDTAGEALDFYTTFDEGRDW